MSFGESTVDLHLDATKAERELQSFLAKASKSAIPVQADTKTVVPAIEKSVKSANSVTVITADTKQVAPAIEKSVTGAKSSVTVEADAKAVTSRIEGALAATKKAIAVEADTGAMQNRIQAALADVRKVVTVEADASDVTSTIEDAIFDADTSVTVDVDSRGFEQVKQQIDEVKQKASGASEGILSLFKITPGKVAAAVGSMVILSGASYNALVQRTQAAFTTLLGSADAASAKIQEIIEFAKTSPFPRQVFLQATQQLIGFGLEAEKVVPILGAVQDAVAATGGGAEDIQMLTGAISQVVASGRLGGEALQQFSARGIDAVKLIAQQTGKSSAEIKDALSEGAIGGREALDLLTKGLNEQFGGAAENVKKTWVGAVDRIKAATRDLGSAIVEPFISTKGGGAAVDFANSLADALRRLEDGIVPIAQQMSEALVPVVDALGTELLPAMVDALIAMAPALGTTSTLLSALAPLITLVADVLERIPDPILQAAGALYIFHKAAEPLGNVFGSMGNAFMEGMGKLSVATGFAEGGLSKFSSWAGIASGASGAFASAMGAIASPAGLASLAVIGANIAISDWQKTNREAAEATQEYVEALEDVEGAADSAVDAVIRKRLADSDAADALIDYNADLELVTEGLKEQPRVFEELDNAQDNIIDGTETAAEVFEKAGIKSSALTKELIRLIDKTDMSAGAKRDLIETLDGEADRLQDASDKAEKHNKIQGDTKKKSEEVAEATKEEAKAAEEAAKKVEEQTKAYQELAAQYPDVADKLAWVTAGYDQTGISAAILADRLNQVGASGDAIAHIADQLGVPEERLGAFVETMGKHLDDLRGDILEGLPTLDKVFSENDREEDESAKHWVKRITDSVNEATEVINNFGPNLEKLRPWPALREFAAREGPEYTQALVDVLGKGNTAILDAQNEALGNHNLALLTATDQINQWAPGFASVNQLAAFSGASAFTGAYAPTTAPGTDAAKQELEDEQSAYQAAAGGAGAAAGEAGTKSFFDKFKPDALTAMNELPTQMDATGVAAAAGAAGTVGGISFTQTFDPNVSEAMANLNNQISGWGVVMNNTLTLMGQGATASFIAGFGQPDVSPAMLSLTGALSGWTQTLNGIVKLMGGGAAQAFVDGFSPVGGMAVTAFQDSFKPNVWPALSGALAKVTMASVTFNNLMAAMGRTGTQVFFNEFRPEPGPALQRMLQTANSYIGPMGQAGAAAGRAYSQYLNAELQAGSNTVTGIVGQYASKLAAGLNPILRAIGKPQITLSQGAIVRFARGGIEDHIAQIAPAGALRIWAEPETGGEAYIPLAPQKRQRSRKIANETVRRLGGHVAWFEDGGVQRYAGGGVTGDTKGLHPIFLARLFAWASSLGRVYNVGSGYRSIAEQARLYARWLARVPGQAQAAPPGSSMHNFGLASDGSEWRGFNPGAFGLRYPMSFEPWHVEPNEARAWAGRAPSGEGWSFEPLPKPPAMTISGALAQVASDAMQHVYDASLKWAQNAFGVSDIPVITAASTSSGNIPMRQGGITVHRRFFDSGGILAPGVNVVTNATGRSEELSPGGTNIIFQDGAVRVGVPAGTTPTEARALGRQVGRGINEALAERRVRTEARLGGGR